MSQPMSPGSARGGAQAGSTGGTWKLGIATSGFDVASKSCGVAGGGGGAPTPERVSAGARIGPAAAAAAAAPDGIC